MDAGLAVGDAVRSLGYRCFLFQFPLPPIPFREAVLQQMSFALFRTYLEDINTRVLRSMHAYNLERSCVYWGDKKDRQLYLKLGSKTGVSGD